MYILTCRHVVFDEDEGGIPMYDLAFQFASQIYMVKNLKYVGSSDAGRDLSIFEVIGVTSDRHGFQLSEFDIYQGQSIIVAGFPIAIDEEGILLECPKLLSGIVSAAGAVHDVALADISAAMPNMSGGPVLSKCSEFKLLLGLHLGVYWHEQTAHKPIKEAEQLPSSATEGYHIVQDRIILSKPAVIVDDQSLASPGKEDIPDIDALSIVGSPPENIRSRGLYAMENVPQKGSMAYFVPTHTIVRYLVPNINLKRILKSSHTTQRSKSTRNYKKKSS